MSAVVWWMVWTYAALMIGWWVGLHWHCVRACGRWCVSDERVDAGLREQMERAGWIEVETQAGRDVLAQADRIGADDA